MRGRVVRANCQEALVHGQGQSYGCGSKDAVDRGARGTR